MDVDVIIIGAGFAGLSAAIHLARQARNLAIALVDERGQQTYTPLLYEFIENGRNPLIDYRALLPPALRFFRGHGRLAGRDERMPSRFQVLVAAEGTEIELRSPALLLATGALTASSSAPLSLSSYEGARAALRRLDAWRPAGIQIAGAGPHGVELACALRIRYPTARIEIHARGGRLLPALPEAAGCYAQRALRQQGIAVHLHSALAGDMPPPARTVRLSATGLRNDAPALRDLLGPWREQVATLAGSQRILVDAHGQVPGVAGLYALGDVSVFAAAPRLPSTAQRAAGHGRQWADNFLRQRRGGQPAPLGAPDLGGVVRLGPRDGIAWLNSPSQPQRQAFFEGMGAQVLDALAQHKYLLELGLAAGRPPAEIGQFPADALRLLGRAWRNLGRRLIPWG